MIIDWPPGLVPFESDFAQLANAVLSPGVSTTGQRRVIDSPAAHWRLSFSVHQKTPAQRMMLRGLLAVIGREVGVVRVPFFEEALREYVAAPGVNTGVLLTPTGSTPHANGVLFASGVGYAPPQMTATSQGEVLPGATRINLKVDGGTVLVPGLKFCDGDWAYEIREVVALAGGVQRVSFRPRLRAEILAGRPIWLENIRCRMRLDGPPVIDKGLLQMGVARLSFVEAIP
jgi:hypothetical protein